MADPKADPTPTESFLHVRGLAARVEYVHTEQKQFRDEQIQHNHALDSRVQKLEFLDADKQERMASGSRTFEALRDEIRRPWWYTVGLMMPGIIALVGFAYGAGKMPGPDEFKVMQSQVNELRIEGARTQTALMAIQKALDELNDGLRTTVLLRAAPKP